MEPYFYQCHYLDRGNPFLKLGPFYYEPLNDIPHVAIVRQFAFPSEMDNMKKQVIPTKHHRQKSRHRYTAFKKKLVFLPI